MSIDRAVGWLKQQLGVVLDVLAVLDQRARRGLALLLVLVLIRAVIEVAGVASLYPVFALVANPDHFLHSPAGRWLAHLLGDQDRSTLLLKLLIAYAVLTAVGALAMVLITLQQFRFIYALQLDISTRLLKGYLSKPYEYFFQRNSATLAKDVNVSTAEFAAGFVLYGLFLLSSAIMLAALVIFLMTFGPVVVIAVGSVLLIAFGGIVWLIREPLTRWGKARDQRMGEMFQTAEDAFAAVRDIKVSGKEKFFVSRFHGIARQYAAMNLRFQAASVVPNHFVQASLMLLAAGVCIVLLLTGTDLLPLTPILGVFYIALSRMLPLGNALYSNWTTVTYYRPSLSIIKAGLDDVGRNAAAEPIQQGREPIDDTWRAEFGKVLSLEGVSYRYPQSERDALSEVSLEIPYGAQVAIVGPSGSGKSTLLDVLLGLLQPTSGSAMVGREPLSPAIQRAWRDQIGYVPQHLFLFDLSLRENVALGVMPDDIDTARVKAAIRMANLEHVVETLPDGYKTRLGDRGVRLSGGERQRVGIARALYRSPRVLVLDEATSGLDAATETSILGELAQFKGRITMIVVSHRLETLSSCDRLYYLEHGRVIAAGSYEEVMHKVRSRKTTNPSPEGHSVDKAEA